MCNVEDLFYRPDGKTAIEGYLGDEAKEGCKILFVLREPNSGGYNEASGEFWMHRVATGEKLKHSSYYRQVLGTLAIKLCCPDFCKEPFEPTDECLCQALRNCAYINLYPFSGAGRKGERFELTNNELTLIKSDCSFAEQLSAQDIKKYEKIALNRYCIMSRMICDYIITTPEIFIALVGGKKADASPHDTGFKLGNGISFCAAEFKGKTLLSYYHPRYTGVSYNNLHRIEYKH